MKRLLIDTNIYSYALKGDGDVVKVLRKTEEMIGFSVISIGELLYGFFKKRGAGNRMTGKSLKIFWIVPGLLLIL